MNIKKELKKRASRLLLLIILVVLSFVFYDTDFSSLIDSVVKSEHNIKPDNEKTSSDQDIITGEVFRVADGDTFTMRTKDGQEIKIRLYAIDAPEKGQDYGTKSRQHLNDLCYGKVVEVRVQGVDQYNRTLGTVFVDNLNVNEYLVRNGLAWYYDNYANDPRLDSLEKKARKERLNIWSMKNPVKPHEYRKAQKANKS